MQFILDRAWHKQRKWILASQSPMETLACAMRGNDQNVPFIEVIVNDWFVTQLTSVEILQCQCLWLVISHLLKGCRLFTKRIKGFVDCWSVRHLSSVACWHCYSLYRDRFYFWASGLCSLYWRNICYIKVLFHTFYCNFGWDVEYRSLYWGLC